jgi:hypothetical protein
MTATLQVEAADADAAIELAWTSRPDGDVLDVRCYDHASARLVEEDMEASS